MLNPTLSQLKNKLLSKDKCFAKKDYPSQLIYIHDLLMSEYGWIPLADFVKLPMETIDNLCNAIYARHEREKKAMNNNKR